jgi:hypothetical protein
MIAISILHVSGSLTEQTAYARSDLVPMWDLVKRDVIKAAVSLPADTPLQIEQAEDNSGSLDDIERWRWIVMGLGWGW